MAHGAQADHRVVVTTTDSREAAGELAKGLVDARLAACVQVVGPIRSVYRWDGEVQDDQEWQCWIKTTGDRVVELTEWIKANHGYDVPEVLALPVLGGNPEYLAWMTEQTRRA